MQTNKTFYGSSLGRKNLKKSPEKGLGLAKIRKRESGNNLKLPSVHHSPIPQSK